MTISRDRYREGLTWDDWLERIGDEHPAWAERFEAARLGPLRADYEDVPTPRYVACIVRADCIDSMGTVPYIARACDQAGLAGGVDLRFFPADAFADLATQYEVRGHVATPICVVMAADRVQVGHWGPRPEGARALAERLEGTVSETELQRELERWYVGDEGRSTLREFLSALRGQPVPPWRAGKNRSEHAWKQAEQARERP